MLEVGLPGVCAYVENKICPNVVGVVILILSELPCLCSVSTVSVFFYIYFVRFMHISKEKAYRVLEKNRVQGMSLTPMLSFCWFCPEMTIS